LVLADKYDQATLSIRSIAPLAAIDCRCSQDRPSPTDPALLLGRAGLGLDIAVGLVIQHTAARGYSATMSTDGFRAGARFVSLAGRGSPRVTANALSLFGAHVSLFRARLSLLCSTEK